MTSKIILFSFAISALLIMGIYFISSPSYEKSIQAKYYYEIGEYKEAYTLARESFSLNQYNRMASTVMAQSKISLEYILFIEEAKKYMDDINQIATNDIISSADKSKIRMMCEIIIGSYIKLAPSVVTDTNLTKSAAKYNSMFEKLLEKVNK
ncbi:MAG: hypothetical protein U9P72_00195 [Campylobacterota bacterium]|nr:hypothetical protein [Campylobacterota bacterium]